MGVWGTGIYSNDTAADVKELCDEIFPFVTVEEGNRIVFQEFKEIVTSDLIDDDFASFWYALADWQWKHGILSEEIRLKAIELLVIHAGIGDWEESATAADVKKRIAVMDKLKTRLETPMPAPKLPKGKLLKPKHKVGDIIIIKTFSKMEDSDDDTWVCLCGHTPFEYASPHVRESSKDFSKPVYAYNKYLAILCVGTEKRLHSEYLTDLYDENSVYAFYDYCDTQKPSLDSLNQCGFLPCITHSYNIEERKVENIGWTYKFITSSSFRINTAYGVDSFEKLSCLEEIKRFNSLLERKSYLNESIWCLDLYHAFSDFFEEKVRLLNLNIEIDTLVDINKANPALLNEVRD